jgi:4'-phosphopantetheinyl transferase
MMSLEERKRYERFHFEKHRHHFLVSRGLMRTMLARYARIKPEDLRFSKNPYGRPEIDDGNAGTTLHFNLSHTDGLIACTVGWHRAIGVDVEDMQRRVEISKIADRFFTPGEREVLHAMDPGMKRSRFFDYWTLKESYLKARGTGLSVPLDRLGFHLSEDHRISVTFDDRLNEEPEHWRFWTLSPTPRHRAALAVHWNSATSPCLCVKKVVPLVDEKPFDCPIAGSSKADGCAPAGCPCPDDMPSCII